MKTLERHEEFEMLVLNEMRKIRVLDQLAFGGGTMLRLCFDLPRYSVDLDFYLTKDGRSFKPWAQKLSEALRATGAEITDEQEKHYSFLWEIRLNPYPRKLKIEARKENEQAREVELNIAHSPFSPLQVRLRTLSLHQMWINKVRALTDRKEIRDAYDLEFLTRRRAGDFSTLGKSVIQKVGQVLDAFPRQDYKVKLGCILSEAERETVISNRFSYLKSVIAGCL